MLLLVAAAGFMLWPSRGVSWPALPSLSLPSLPSLPSLSSKSDAPRASVKQAPSVASAPASAPSAPVAAAPAPAPAPTTTPVAPPPAPEASGVIIETVHAADAGASPAADTPPTGIAVVRANDASWVEARDARGTLLLSRTLAPGESVGLDGPLPLKLVIGNATATEVTMRGKRVTLGAPNRDNVVKVELK